MKSFTPLQFFESRLTQQEQLALISAVLAGDSLLALFVLKFVMAERIVGDDPRLAQGKELLIAKGLLSQQRANEVFNFID
jgi:hypothetical protein